MSFQQSNPFFASSLAYVLVLYFIVLTVQVIHTISKLEHLESFFARGLALNSADVTFCFSFFSCLFFLSRFFSIEHIPMHCSR